MSAAVLGREWIMLPSSSSHEQQQQQEKKASQLFAQRALQERRLKPPDQVIACPRCQSLNTKFCYYNNYSLTQPRHFCKSCRRYWTAGGTLRNVPVGGGCRKNKRSKPRTPDVHSSGALSGESDSSSVPGLQHSGYASTSAAFLDSSEGVSPFACAEQSIRTDPSGCQSAEAGLSLPLHASQSAGLPQHTQPFESGISGLSFFRSARPETTLNLHPSFQGPSGDLSAIFENPNVSRVGALAALSEGLVTYSTNPEAGRDQQSFTAMEGWRAQKQHAQSGVWGNEALQAEVDLSRQQFKGKNMLSMSPSAMSDEKTHRPAPTWQHPVPQESNSSQYEQTPDHNFWSNTGWPAMDLQTFPSSGGGQVL